MIKVMKKVMYRRTVIVAGPTKEIVETYPTQFGDNMRREGRKGGKGTPEAVKLYNRKLAKRRLTRIINANFVADDLWITLTYERDNRPESREAAKEILQKFIRRLRYEYRKSGLELKAVKATARGERGALHHHVIVNQGVPTRQITTIWREVSGGSEHAHPPYYVPLYPEGEFSSLASYLVDQIEVEEGELFERKWTATRNLKKPEYSAPQDIAEIKWQEPPEAEEGYYIDTSSIEAGTNEMTGRPYLFYRMVKIEDGFTCRDDNGKLLRGAKAVEYFRDKNRKFIRDNWITISPEGEVIFYDGG